MKTLFPALNGANAQFLDPCFLDCGAHSVGTGIWEWLPVDDYAKWVKDHQENFCLIAAPDEIGDAKTTEKQTLDFVRNTQGSVDPAKIVPIYHITSQSTKDFHRVIDYAKDYGAEWFAIGGAIHSNYSLEQKQTALEYFFRKIPRDRFKVHLLGVPQPSQVALFVPDSVDSSTALWGSKTLEHDRYYPEINAFKGTNLKKLNTKQLTKYVADRWERLLDLCEIEADIAQMRFELERISDPKKMTCLNAYEVVYMEKCLRKMTGKDDFLYRVTLTTYDLPVEVERLFYMFYSPRTLVSFAQFYTWGGGTNNNLLSIIRKEGTPRNG